MTKSSKLEILTKNIGLPLGDMFGIFFEDLNHAADGGLYAELVQNRSFEFDPIDHPNYHSLTAWEKIERAEAKCNIYVSQENPLNSNNAHYLVIDVEECADGAGVMNLGFNTGIPLRQQENYLFSCYARTNEAKAQSVCITLEGENGNVYGSTDITVDSQQWSKYEAKISANATDFNGRLCITLKSCGRLDLDMVSLFPEKTFKGRKNGMRQDIAQLLADMTPKFMRFPGGCLVHDGSINAEDRNSMYRWKNTIGDIEKRPSRRNNWRYNQTLGLGYYEYFLFCEDIGAKPLPVLPGGYDPHHKRIVPIDELQPWIDDALDLIEFANGDITSTWGAKRAELGHAEPFKLEYLAIGNEEVGEPFFERYTYFHKAIKQKYPEIKLINSSGPFAAGKEYERGWKSARDNQSDMVDEHYYMSPEWFLANHHRYDHFKADEPKVFLGEYATWGNAYYNALVEASYMIGLQKNAHAVALACYAPMLCNVDYTNWKPDMIWFNNNSCYGTPNYYVQKLFMNHQGDHLLTVNATGLDNTTKPEKKNIAGSIILSCNKKEVEYYDIKLINTDTAEERAFDKFALNENNHFVELCKTDWENYKLIMTAKEIKDKKDPQSQSQRGFKIFFGQADDKNRLFWEVGGRQNQDSVVCADTNGRNACLTQSLFSVEADRAYPFELEVTGRHIKTTIDRVIINETEDKLPVIEPLYYSASIENSTKDIILKVVNVQETVVSTEISLVDFTSKNISGTIYELSGNNAVDENSFLNPLNVKPKEREFSYNSNCFNYEFPKCSITVFRIKQNH